MKSDTTYHLSLILRSLLFSLVSLIISIFVTQYHHNILFDIEESHYELIETNEEEEEEEENNELFNNLRYLSLFIDQTGQTLFNSHENQFLISSYYSEISTPPPEID